MSNEDETKKWCNVHEVEVDNECPDCEYESGTFYHEDMDKPSPEHTAKVNIAKSRNEITARDTLDELIKKAEKMTIKEYEELFDETKRRFGEIPLKKWKRD